MAKYHGSKGRIYAGGYDLSGSTSSLEFADTVETAEDTTFGASAKAYLTGLVNSKITQKTFYDDSIGAIEPMIAAVRGTSGVPASFYPGGDASGNPGYGGVAELLAGAKITSSVKDAVILDADWEISGGSEALTSILAETQFTGNGAQQVPVTQDNGAATTNGGSAYFHVTQVQLGATVSPLKLQHSADNVAFTDLVTSTLAGNAVGGDREAVAAGTTVNRYLRVVYALTNGDTATIQVGFHRA